MNLDSTHICLECLAVAKESSAPGLASDFPIKHLLSVWKSFLDLSGIVSRRAERSALCLNVFSDSSLVAGSAYRVLLVFTRLSRTTAGEDTPCAM